MVKEMQILVFLLTLSLFFTSSLFSQTNPISWNWQNPKPQGNHLYDVHMFDSQRVISGGSAGTIIYTTNAGNEWEIEHSVGGYQTTPYTKTIWSLSFFSDGIGWATRSDGRILKSTDYGETWTQQYSTGGPALTGCSFVNENEGWVCGGGGKIFHTTNSGN